MPAKVTFLVGRAGSGKSDAVYERVADLIRCGEQPLLIVPEQFTFEAEKALCQKLGRGLLGSFVTSFPILCTQALKETGKLRPYLTPVGRRMLIRKVVRERAKSLRFFGSVCEKQGFAVKLEETFRVLRRHAVSPAEFSEAIQALPQDGYQREKLSDIAFLYDSVLEQQKAYMEQEDAQEILVQVIHETSLCGRDVFIDGFYQLTGQLYNVIGALLVCSKSVTVSICMDPDEEALDKHVFAPCRRIYQKILDMAKDKGLSISRQVFLGEPAKKQALSLLCKKAFTIDKKEQVSCDAAIEIVVASNVEQEAQALGEAISAAARSGIRYREMAIIASDLDLYAMPVRRMCTRLNLPLYVDAGRPIVAHPLAVLCLNALKYAGGGQGIQPFLEVIKSGFGGIGLDESDLFENYILKYGIRGSMLTAPLIRGKEEELETIEPLRKKVVEPLLTLKQELKDGDFAQKTLALYRYLERLNVKETLTSFVNDLAQKGLHEFAQESAQVYEYLMQLFEQFFALKDEAQTSNKDYILMFEEGLTAYDAGVVPSTLDQISFGSVTRAREGAVKKLFILGCVQGLLPKTRFTDQIIDDREIDLLQQAGIEIWNTTEAKIQDQRFELYRALTRPTEELYLSYSVNMRSAESEPSFLIERVKELFYDVPVQQALFNRFSLQGFLDSPVYQLGKGLRQMLDEKHEPKGLKKAFASIARNPEFEEAIGKIEDALFYNPFSPCLSEEASKNLIKNLVSSSRLELYNACPFRYFMDYGLLTRERDMFEERLVDEGSLFHDCLDAFVDVVKDRQLDYCDLTEDQVEALVDDIWENLLLEHNDGFLLQNGRNQAKAGRMKAMTRATAKAMAKQIAVGGFRPFKTELAFGPDEELESLVISDDLSLVGRIDRVDMAEKGDMTYLRVIDYKRGNVKLDYSEVYAGIRLQLPLYLCAAMALKKEAKPAGLYYLRVHEAVLSPVQKKDELLSLYRLAGISLADPVALSLADQTDQKKSKVLPKDMISYEDMQDLMKYAKKKALRTVEKIREGNIAVTPYSYKNKTACDYCVYKSVCGFDQTLPYCRFSHVSSVKQDDFFEEITKEQD